MVDNNLKNVNANFVNLKDNESVALYVKDIMKIKPLKGSEEKNLFIEYNDANTSEARKLEIRNEIISRNQRFVYAIAKRYAQDETLLDLISEGNLGMFEAFDDYDYTTGHRFCTLAVWYIRRAINAYINTGSVLIKKSNNTKTLNKVMDIQDKFLKCEGRYATNDEIIDILRDEYGLDIKKKEDLFDLKIDSINTCYDDEDNHAFENSSVFVNHTSVSEDCVFDNDSDYGNTVIDYLKEFLNENEKKVIELAFGEKELSNKEIGEILGVSSERARQIKNSAIKKMQAHAEEVKASI